MSTPPRAAVPVRRATPDDAEELVRLRGIMLGSLAGRDDGTAWQPAALRMLHRRLADPDGDLAVFVVDWPAADGADRSGTDADVGADAGTGADGTDADRADADRTDAGRADAGARGAGRALAACAAGTVEHRLPGPHSPLGLVGHVFNVATDPALRRRGYSRACMSALLAWYRERGVRKIDLFASAEGEPLYADLGFARKGDPAMRLEY